MRIAGQPVVCKVHALIVWAPAPAVGLLHTETQGIAAAHLNGLAVDCRSAGNLLSDSCLIIRSYTV